MNLMQLRKRNKSIGGEKTVIPFDFYFFGRSPSNILHKSPCYKSQSEIHSAYADQISADNFDLVLLSISDFNEHHPEITAQKKK
ncbi:MAG: hypothetical protein MZV64_37170 [Ignavibacteriales bacterium]|nr:hypothetical protein [Ignavibacteriales bacterium]